MQLLTHSHHCTPGDQLESLSRLNLASEAVVKLLLQLLLHCDCSMGRSSEEDSRGEAEEGGGGEAGEPDPTLPCTEDVILKTEQVTKNIQELLRAAQEFKHDR